MKRVFIFQRLFFVVCFTVLLIGCDEETGSISKSNVNIITNDSDLTDLLIINNTISIEEFLANPDDPDDEKINKKLYEISLLARNLLKDKSFNKLIEEDVNVKDNKVFDLRELSLSFKSSDMVYKDFERIIKDCELTHKSINSESKEENESYIPGIYVPNSRFADFNLTPIISPGIEINPDIKGMEEYEDYIIAWYWDKSGKLMEIMLNEEMVMNTKHPVFIIDNADEFLTNSLKYQRIYDNKDVSTLKSINSIQYFSSYEYQINVRHEGIGGESELWIDAFWVRDDGSYGWVKQSSGAGTKIADVSKNDIGTLLYKWVTFNSSGVNFEPYSQTHVFFNLFERDWFSSLKLLGMITLDNENYYLTGNMSYDNDWYLYDPNGIIPESPMASIYQNWACWFESDRCKYRLWRCD